jgi:predicted nucleic acid-binding protein
VYLLDTNIWLEQLLAQTQAKSVGQLLDTITTAQLLMSDFSLHSIGVILGRLGASPVFNQFVQDVLIDGGVGLISLAPVALQQVASVMALYRLDFDDGYQYMVAEQENVIIVSFDSDFDRTPRGRQTPAQILATLGSL